MTERYCPAWGPGSPVCPRSICDCFIDEFPDDMEQAGALHPEFFTVVAMIEDSSLGTPGAAALRARTSPQDAAAVVARAKELEAAQWERCAGCRREFAYLHLCRTHMLCGICHKEVPHGPPF